MAKVSRKITKEELTQKIGAENLALVEGNVYCTECRITAIVNYGENIVVEPSGDR